MEARTPGGDDWTTLPDANGHTTTATGLSCPAGWVELHPHLAHYQTWDGVDACTATGPTGAWNAASGNSAGWQDWSIDLSAYAGETVEISIAYASDWATQGIGVFVDDIALPDGTSTSFEAGLDGWAIAGPPEGSAPNVNNFIQTDASGFPVGNAISTPHSLLLGFGLEGVSTAGRTQRSDGPGARPPAGLEGESDTTLMTLTRGERTVHPASRAGTSPWWLRRRFPRSSGRTAQLARRPDLMTPASLRRAWPNGIDVETKVPTGDLERSRAVSKAIRTSPPALRLAMVAQQQSMIGLIRSD